MGILSRLRRLLGQGRTAAERSAPRDDSASTPREATEGGELPHVETPYPMPKHDPPKGPVEFPRDLIVNEGASSGGSGPPLGSPAAQIASDSVSVHDSQSMINAIQHYSEQKLLAGFTVLVQDAFAYRSLFQGRDGELFDVVLGPLVKEAASLPAPARVQFPAGIIKAAAEGNLSSGRINEKLGSDSIVTPENVAVGKRFWAKFVRKFKETICGPDGPYEALNKGLAGQAALPGTIAASIVTGCLSASGVWIPLAGYGGLLLAKAGLKTYCEADDLSSP